MHLLRDEWKCTFCNNWCCCQVTLCHPLDNFSFEIKWANVLSSTVQSQSDNCHHCIRTILFATIVIVLVIITHIFFSATEESSDASACLDLSFLSESFVICHHHHHQLHQNYNNQGRWPLWRLLLSLDQGGAKEQEPRGDWIGGNCREM